MTRSDLEKKAIKTLELDGYTCERAYNKAVYIPGKGYVGKRFDFFHVLDIIALSQTSIRFIQVTSEDAETRSHATYLHKKKIQSLWKLDIPVELWTYTKKSGRWWLSIMVYSGGEWVKYDNPEVSGYDSTLKQEKMQELVNINEVNNNE